MKNAACRRCIRARSGCRLILALLYVLGTASASPADETVLFDPARTTVEFTLGAALHTVHGTFKLRRGMVTFDPATGKASGSIVVDAASGDSGNGARDRRMHRSILESDRYPEIVFTPDRVDGKVVSNGPSQVQVHGRFRIHGAEHEVTLPFQVRAASGEITADTVFPLPYVKWGMKNPSTFLLKVNETLEIGIHGAGRLSAASGL